MGRPGIRRADTSDAAEMARLSGELGYPMSVEEMRTRLGRLLGDARHFIAVAHDAEQRLVGWMHVEHRTAIDGGEGAELMGLVVDGRVRRRGTGRTLVDAAEQWSQSQGLAGLTVRSSVARELSHPFYEALGYVREKTQHVYRKRFRGSAE
jgi:GNAT superfamily N-acetyltransferase